MSSAKKIFSNLGVGFRRLLHGGDSGNENGINVPYNKKEEMTDSQSYCNQIYKFETNEHESDLPENELDVRTHSVSAFVHETPRVTHTDTQISSSHEQNTITPSVFRHNYLSDERMSPSVIRYNSKDPETPACKVGTVATEFNADRPDIFSTQSAHNNACCTSSTPFSRENFESGHKLLFDDSPCNKSFRGQSFKTNTIDCNRQNSKMFERDTHFQNDVKWRDDVMTSTGDHLTHVQECGKGNNQINRDKINETSFVSRNKTSRDVNQTYLFDTQTNPRDEFTNNTHLAGACQNTNWGLSGNQTDKTHNWSPWNEQNCDFSTQIPSYLSNKDQYSFDSPRSKFNNFNAHQRGNAQVHNSFNERPAYYRNTEDMQYQPEFHRNVPSHYGNVGREIITSFPNGPRTERSYRKQKDPDTYDGKFTEWNDYICHFEQVALWNSWAPHEMASQLAMCLRGSAQRALSELSLGDLSDYGRLKASLTQRFCPPEREAAHRCEFRNRRRKRGETVAEYGYSLKRLAAHAFPKIPYEIREGFIIEQYISGLSDPDMKRHVQFSHPNTLDRAISLALEFEAFEGSQVNNMSRKPKEEDFVPICNSIKVNEQVNDQCSQSSIFTKMIENMQETQKSIVEGIQGVQRSMQTMMHKQADKGSFRNNTHTTGHRESTPRKKIRCFYCKEEGHMKSDCPILNKSNFEVTQKKGSGSSNLNGK